MRCVITVVGKDMVGILASVSGICKECNVNVTEVSQSILQDMFCMMMMADASKSNVDFPVLPKNLPSTVRKTDCLFMQCTRTSLIQCIEYNRRTSF